MARLRITCGDGIEQILELREQKVRIGRGQDNDLVLPDPQKGVSRAHAELRYENGRYVILDLQSQNGTWVDGRRVERAEVPVGAVIALGEYRLMLQNDPPHGNVAHGARETRPVSFDDMQLRDVAARPAAPARATAPATRLPMWVIVAIAVTAVVAVAAVVRTMKVPAGGAPAVGTDRATPAASSGAPDVPAAAPRTPERPVEGEPRDDSQGLGNLLSKSPTVRPGGEAARLGVDAVPTARVVRRPGESVEAWRNRAAALQTRYGYSKAALDRGDYAAAAGGFEAILLEEPGYRDAPKLLVQAQAGLRSTARNLYEAGARLDAAGDWVGALKKYEQAHQIYAGLPGVSDSLRKVREKLRVAGTTAFNHARQHEAGGRLDDALREYEKAAQWLPEDDPNRLIARARVAQLRRN